jgi:CubicO group peptidase (beta-lactamase class C family)
MTEFQPSGDKPVTRTNFMQAPFNRWAFQHIRELQPTREIYRGDGPVSRLESIPQVLNELLFDGAEGRQTNLQQWQQQACVDAMLVLHKGSVAYEVYLNGQQPQTRHQMFSVTKSWVVVVVLIMAEQGRIDLNRNVANYLPELANSAFGDATVQQLMDMTVAVDYDEEYENEDSAIHGYGRVFNIWGETPVNYDGPVTLYDYLPTLHKKGEHGFGFLYVTPDTDVLAWIVSRVSGQNISSMIEKLVFQPLGPEQNAYLWLDKVGTETAGAGLNICARDAARFGQMILQKGYYNDKQIVPESVAERILQPGDPETFNRIYKDDWYEQIGYAYHDQWWTWNNPHKAVSAMGIHGQHIYLDPLAGMVIVVQSSHANADSDAHELDAPQLFHAIGEYLSKCE